jgi:hypothetical protein
MRTPRLVWTIVFSLAGAAAMPPSAHAFSNKRWMMEPSNTDGAVGAWSEQTAGAQAPSTFNGGADGPEASWIEELEPLVDERPYWVGDTAGTTRYLGVPLLGSVEAGGPRGTEPYWPADSMRYSETGLGIADVRLDLPALVESDWSENPLLAENEAFLMEQVVLPTLGAFSLICIVTVAVVRHRERRAASPSRHLLQV